MRFKGTDEEGRWMLRLVNAYTAAVSVVEQLSPMMNALGLLKANGGIDVDKVLAIRQSQDGSDVEVPQTDR